MGGGHSANKQQQEIMIIPSPQPVTKIITQESFGSSSREGVLETVSHPSQTADSIPFLQSVRVKHIPLDFAQRFSNKASILTSSENAELHPNQPRSLFSIEDLAIASRLFDLGSPATIDSPYHFHLLLQDLTLLNFPSLSFASTLFTGFRNGFTINRRTTQNIRPSRAYNNPPEILEAILASHAKDISLGRAWKVPKDNLSDLNPSWLPQFAVPQKTKFRIISDAKQTGLNNCIDLPAFGTLKMDSIPLLLDDIRAYPPGADLYIITTDCASYFRQFPLSLPDRIYTLLVHDPQTYLVDGRLPFGISSAPILSHQFLDLVAWVMSKKFNIPLRHYSDNTFCVVRGQDIALQTQVVIEKYFSYLGVETNPQDSQCSRCANVLGLDIDATSRWAAIPSLKRRELQSLIKLVLDKAQPKVFMNLVSRLVWYCCIILGGMSHAVTLWNLLDSHKTNFSCITLTQEAVYSLHWFQSLFFQWDCVYYFDQSSDIIAANGIPTLASASDASPLGAAVVTSTSFTSWSWCACCWKDTQDISSFELAALLIALSTFLGSKATRAIVAWHTDSQSAVDLLKRGYSSNPPANTLLQEVFLAMSVYHCHIIPIWVPRDKLPTVDAHSRGNTAHLPPLPDGRTFVAPQGCLTIRKLFDEFTFGFSRNH